MFVEKVMASKRSRDGKKIGKKILQDRALSHLMPALFRRDFDQWQGTFTLSASVAATDRSRYTSKGDLHTVTDRSRYISIDAESYFRGSDEIDGKSDGRNDTHRKKVYA